ncbi:hypothetical protein [Mesorhizobium sp. BHbdii]
MRFEKKVSFACPTLAAAAVLQRSATSIVTPYRAARCDAVQEIRLHVASRCHPWERAIGVKAITPLLRFIGTHKVAVAVDDGLYLELPIDEQSAQEFVLWKIINPEAATNGELP